MQLSYRNATAVASLVIAVVGGFVVYRTLLTRRPPPAPARPEPRVFAANFTQVKDPVNLKAIGRLDWVRALIETPLSRGDMVRTGAEGSAEIRFFDGTLLHARPDSLITIEETSEDPFSKRRKVAWHVTSGEVNFQTGEKNVPDSATEVSTPTVRATAGAMADAAVRVAPSGESELRVFRGEGRVQTVTGQRLVVAANEALSVNATGQAGEKRALPGVPGLNAPPDGAELNYPEGAVTTLAWDAVAGATTYRLMLDIAPAFTQPVFDQHDVAGTSLALPGLKSGEYYWRVAARMPDGLEGRFSEPARFKLIAPDASTMPPSLTASLEVRQNVVQVNGRTDPGAQVTINDIAVSVGADGTFTEYLTLAQPGQQVVVIRSTGQNKVVAEQRRKVVARF